MPVELICHKNTMDRLQLPIAFLSHTFTDTQWKRSTTEQEAYGIYSPVTKWNYYLQGSDIVVHNDHKSLKKFWNGKNANNTINRWSMELPTHNITFEWISGAHNKAADCLSWLEDVKDTPVTSNTSIIMVVTSTLDGPATDICSKTLTHTDTIPPTDVKSTLNTDKVTAAPPLKEDCKDTVQCMQKTDIFCKCISKWLLNGKAPSHKFDTFTHIKCLLYQHAMDSNQKFLALVIPKSWHFTVFVEVHDKLGHQRVNRNYHPIKWQYYWKGMNKDIHRYITNCVLCKREKVRTHVYPLQMTDIPDRPFDKIAIYLVTDLSISISGNQHILTIIDHLTGWPETFPIPDKKADTIFMFSSIITYLSTCALTSYCQTMGHSSRTN